MDTHSTGKKNRFTRAALLWAALAATAATSASAVTVTIKNACTFQIDLYDNKAATALASGAETSRTLSSGYVGMFRHGSSDQATLAEISVDAGSGRPWYDISIIPPGPGNCGSFEACKAATGKTGYNVPMQITPLTNVGSGTCTELTCLSDGCSDGYLFPADDKKTHNCPSGTDFLVTFCPGGAGGATPTPTPTVTPSPTPEPTTAAPTTPPPTTGVPTAALPLLSGDQDSSSGSNDTGSSTPGAVNEDALVGFEGFLGASITSSSSNSSNSSAAPVVDTAPAPSTDEGVVEANTQSAQSSSGSTGLIVALVLSAAALAAAAVIIVVRKKKLALEQLEQKSPVGTPTRGTMAAFKSPAQASVL